MNYAHMFELEQVLRGEREALGELTVITNKRTDEEICSGRFAPKNQNTPVSVLTRRSEKKSIA